MEIQVVLFLSIIFQFTTVLLVLLLIYQFKIPRIWFLIAAAFMLLTVRHVVVFVATLGSHPDYPSLGPELIVLAAAVLVIGGILITGPQLLRLRQRRHELEQHVERHTAELNQVSAALQTESVEREQVADALRHSEARYRAIVENQNDLICRYRPDGILTFVNGACCRQWDSITEALIGQDYFEYMPEQDRTSLQHALALLTPDQPVFVAEYHQTGSEGEQWQEWTHQAIFNEQGHLTEIQAVGRDITRQRRMEESIRQSETQMRLIVQNLPVMVTALDEEGRFVVWNRECERVTGYSLEEITSHHRAIELLPPAPDILEQLQAVYAQLVEDYRDWEITLMAKDGTKRIVAWSNVSRQVPIPGWKLWAIGVDVTGRKQVDQALHEAQEALERRIAERTAALKATNESLQHEITERQRAEMALRTSQAQLRFTLDAFVDPVHVIDRDLRITLHNEAFRQQNEDLGLETRAIGRTPLELFPFLPDTVRDEYRQVFETGQALVTHEITSLSGLTLYTETRKIPVFDGGQVTHVVTVIHDTTEQMRIEQALRQSERDYHGLFESAHDAIIVFDPHSETVLDVNQRGCDMYGYAREEFMGMSLDKLASDAAESKHLIAATLATGSYHHFEATHCRKDGSEITLEINASVVSFLGKQAILSINRDITARQQMEQS